MLLAEPVFLQAAPRLLASFLVTALAAVAARRWVAASGPDAPGDVRLCATVVVTAAAIVSTAIVLGALGLLHDWTWALAVTAVSIALLRTRVRAEPAGAGVGAAGAAASETSRDDRPSFLFAAAVLGILIGRAVYGLRNPPADIDSVHYHLPMVGNWIASAGLGLPLREPPTTSEGYPGNGQLLQLWAAWSTGRETLMSWAGTLFVGVLALALRRLALDSGARRGVAESAAVALSATPGVLQLTYGMRIDNMLAAVFAVALVHALRLRRTGRRFDRDVLLLALGLVAGLKGTAPAHSALIAALAVAGRGVWRRIRALLRPNVALVAALLCGGFWLARNAVATGNPLYPAELEFGPWTLPGALSREFLKGTTQIEIWRQGYPGNLTPYNLWHFYGAGAVAIALGVVAWAMSRVAHRRSPPPATASLSDTGSWSHEESAPLLLAMAAVCLGLFVVSPYSGAFWPEQDGRPPRFAVDNVRYLWPGLVAAFPVAALGLTRLPFARLLPAGLVVVAGALLGRLSGHLVPGVLAAMALLGAFRLARNLPPAWTRLLLAGGGVLACLGLAAAVARVDPMRERLTDLIWDSRHTGGSGLDAAALRTVRHVARDHRIAVVGDVDIWWMCYGRDFSGRPTYVPVSTEWRRVLPRFALPRDDRSRADASRWRANLQRSDAAAIVTGAADDSCRIQPPEETWCASDSTLERIAGTPCAAAYQVPEPPR